MKLRRIIFSASIRVGWLLHFLFFATKLTIVYGQPITTGSPQLEEAYRRAQLLNVSSARHSFMIRPVSLDISDSAAGDPSRIYNLFNEKDSLANKEIGAFNFWNGRGHVKILPASAQTQFNSTHPYGWGDGSMIPNSGYQHLISGGFYGKLGPLTVQLKPEWSYAENKDFEGFPRNYPSQVWIDRNYYWFRSDNPSRFGTDTYDRKTLGNSFVRLNVSKLSLGVSNENIWWGPGQFNALIFSGNPRGFQHLTINTTSPLKTWLGRFEGQIIAGRLESSGFTPEPDLLQDVNFLDEWRYMSGITLVYSPKWLDFLYLGFSRTFQVYNTSLLTFSDYFPYLEPFQKEKIAFQNGSGSSGYDSKGNDQQVGVSLRLLFREAKAEAYFEYGRRDHALNWRDFIMSPDHARAFLFGFSKLFTIEGNELMQVRFEATQSQESINIMVRYGGEEGGQSWGQHTPILQGSTHYGQQLGNGVGPGNNVQTLEVAWVKDVRKLGVMLERLEHQMDFFNRAFRDSDPARPWVDVSTGLVGHWRFNRLLVNGRMQFIKSLNYQWQQGELLPGGQNARGVDRFNFHFYGGVSYLF